mmetsp:Transcript_27821/g.57707  ORF Transcript_27821/g.57707 Transcript_27821/m.57707 type:complete len:121 (+) Transcript_27821:335-697(+)
MFDESSSMEDNHQCSKGYPISQESSSSCMKQLYSQLSITHLKSSLGKDPQSPILTLDTTLNGDNVANQVTAKESLEDSLKLLEIEESTPSLADVTLPPLHGSTQPPSNPNSHGCSRDTAY